VGLQDRDVGGGGCGRSAVLRARDRAGIEWQPVEVFNIESPEGSRASMFAQVDQHKQHGDRLVAMLDHWETLPSLQRMRAEVIAELAPIPGDVICDIGCGTGSELIRLARIIGTTRQRNRHRPEHHDDRRGSPPRATGGRRR
jgi:hypothetical protein